MCLHLTIAHMCWKLNVYFVLSWMQAREGSSQDEVTSKYIIHLPAHCRDVFFFSAV